LFFDEQFIRLSHICRMPGVWFGLKLEMGCNSSRFSWATISALVLSLLLVLAMLLGLDFILVEHLRPIYNAGRLAPVLGRFDDAMTFLGDGKVQAAGIVLLYIVGWFTSPRIREAGKGLIIGFAASGALSQVLKHLLGRARPRVTMETLFIGPTLKRSYDSFPSGHTIVTFCIAYILAAYFPKYRVWFYAFATLVALERIICVTHFPSDVAVGAVVGLYTASLLCRKVLFRLR